MLVVYHDCERCQIEFVKLFEFRGRISEYLDIQSVRFKKILCVRSAIQVDPVNLILMTIRSVFNLFPIPKRALACWALRCKHQKHSLGMIREAYELPLTGKSIGGERGHL